eukprot:4734592-Amphidinium_carterae.1
MTSCSDAWNAKRIWLDGCPGVTWDDHTFRVLMPTWTSWMRVTCSSWDLKTSSATQCPVCHGLPSTSRASPHTAGVFS